MPSFKTSFAIVATALFSLSTRAQYTIDPNNVPLSTRSQWCQSQLTSCPLLCLQLPGESSTTEANDCDATTLTYDCVCGNGMSPNASEFSQTIPYFICTEYGNECVAGCNGDTSCQSACRDDHPCGAQNPTRVNITTSSTIPATGTAASTSATAGTVYTGIGGAAGSAETTAASSSSSSTSSQNGSQAALNIGRSYGLAIVFAGLFAGFALVI